MILLTTGPAGKRPVLRSRSSRELPNGNHWQKPTQSLSVRRLYLCLVQVGSRNSKNSSYWWQETATINSLYKVTVTSSKVPLMPFPLLNLLSTSCAPIEASLIEFTFTQSSPSPLPLIWGIGSWESQITVSAIFLLLLKLLQDWCMSRSRDGTRGTLFSGDVDNGTTSGNAVDLKRRQRRSPGKVTYDRPSDQHEDEAGWHFSQDLDKNASDRKSIDKKEWQISILKDMFPRRIHHRLIYI